MALDQAKRQPVWTGFGCEMEQKGNGASSVSFLPGQATQRGSIQGSEADEVLSFASGGARLQEDRKCADGGSGIAGGVPAVTLATLDEPGDAFGGEGVVRIVGQERANDRCGIEQRMSGEDELR